MSGRVLVLGLGNPLFSDDAAGLLAVRRAASLPDRPPGIDFAELTAGGLELLEALSGYDGALVVDAAVTGQAAPGELCLLDPASLPAIVAGGAHGLHLGGVLETAARMGIPMPRRLEVLAIEAADITTLGEGLTPALAAAIELAARAILERAAAIRRALEQDGAPG